MMNDNQLMMLKFVCDCTEWGIICVFALYVLARTFSSSSSSSSLERWARFSPSLHDHHLCCFIELHLLSAELVLNRAVAPTSLCVYNCALGAPLHQQKLLWGSSGSCTRSPSNLLFFLDASTQRRRRRYIYLASVG